jgi:integrase/recombinase XerD
MSLGKQAKTLTKAQTDALLGHVGRTRNRARNRAIVLLSVKAGLRAKEIANLTWAMVTEPDGTIGMAIHLQDKASKGRSGRIIPLNRELRGALTDLRTSLPRGVSSHFLISTERADRTAPQVVVNLFSKWYADLGFIGCS